ncbi:uncharacterized protein LOC131229526 isoform X2 [Magnolia sinica]|uniref:uncharacterized protein LOC131229526 isoform X2 n=1 Tax=Magnolia sinica TaxID=86752 RepID=UPI00265A2F11|nr:uncharacterized protein LOC131229526 isoform X2 [Magnolia sinica]XP_058081498.1 uncharacterized protein LOC131229526 isoform X2 [Magnolia sinica]
MPDLNGKGVWWCAHKGSDGDGLQQRRRWLKKMQRARLWAANGISETKMMADLSVGLAEQCLRQGFAGFAGHGGARAAEYVKQHYLTPHMHESGGMDIENSTLPSMIFLKQGRSSRHVDQTLHCLSSLRLKQQGAPPSPTCIYGPIHEFSAFYNDYSQRTCARAQDNF